MTDIEKADVLRKAAEIMSTEWGSEPIDEMREYADALDPPYKVDRSLRGWVMIEYDSGVKQVLHAEEHGLTESDQRHAGLITWDEVEKYGWKVTKLHILQPGEVTVKIPPVSKWPERAIGIEWRYYKPDAFYPANTPIITREHAECMEADSPEAELEREKNR